MINICIDNNIQIFVSDNASKDNTETIMNELVSHYNFIHYYKHSENIGPDDNFEYVLKMSDTKYRWLMSDTCFVTDIKDILNDLQRFDLDGYVVNGDSFRAKHLPQQKTVYNESISLMKEVGWHMTWISCMIYNERIIRTMNFDRYKDSSFNQTALMFETTANRTALFCFNPEIVVYSLPVIKESGWLYQEYDVMYRNWTLLIMSLPLYYPYDVKKRTVISGVKYPYILNWYCRIKRRSEGKWSAKDVYRNREFVKFAKGPYIYLLFLGVTPKWILSVYCLLYRKINRINIIVSDYCKYCLKKKIYGPNA